MIIPERYKHVKYEDVPEDIRTKFEKMTETRKGFYIHGAVGSGKTHIAFALHTACFKKLNRHSRFFSTTRLLYEMRKDFDRDGYDKKRLDEELLNYRGLLILDDIGAEKPTEWVEQTFYLIINERYIDKLPTIFTSNLPIGELAQRIGDRTASRIVEMCDVVDLGDKDRRVLQAKKEKK